MITKNIVTIFIVIISMTSQIYCKSWGFYNTTYNFDYTVTVVGESGPTVILSGTSTNDEINSALQAAVFTVPKEFKDRNQRVWMDAAYHNGKTIVISFDGVGHYSSSPMVVTDSDRDRIFNLNRAIDGSFYLEDSDGPVPGLTWTMS